MSSDDLDARIRAMVRDAVDAAPPAPDLPVDDARTAAPRGPRWMWAGIGIAAAVAAVAVLVLTGRGDDRAISVDPTDPETTVSPDSTSVVDGTDLPWPDGVAVIVASERGIERVTAENGQAVVTRVLSGVQVERAFELEDGTIVYQEHLGDIRAIDAQGQPIDDAALVTNDGSLSLQDADAPDGNLRMTYRTSTEVPEFAGQAWVWFQPDSPVTTGLPGGFGVDYRRFTILDGTAVMASTMDDTGQRSAFTFSVGEGEQLAPGFEQPYLVVGDGAGTYVALTGAGTVEWTGASSGRIDGVDAPASVIEMDTRGDWLTLQREQGPASLVDLTNGSPYELPVAGGGGNVSVSRRDHAPSKGVPTTTPSTAPVTPTTGPVPTTAPTTVPGSVNEGQPYPSCLTVTSDRIADVQLGSMFYSIEPLPEEPITVSGRPAVLTTYGTGYGVVFRQPDWCTEYGMTTGTMSKADFLDWVKGVTVTETLPSTMPPVLLRGVHGVSIVTADGTTPVYRGPVDQALLLGDGRVVFHAIAEADFQMWDPATGTSEPMWAAADFLAQPMLHDTYGDSFIFSVGETMYWYDHDQTWKLDPGFQRASILANGGLITPSVEPGATSPDGNYSAFSRSGVVEVDSGNGVEYQSTNSDVEVTDVDLHDAGWLTISEIPPGDSPLRVRLVELSTGRFIQFDGVDGAHLG